MEPTIKVTKIKRRWHARLLCGQKVADEMACAAQRDIGWICREMLRWFDKCGGTSRFAAAARQRQVSARPVGRVWWQKHLLAERTSRSTSKV